VNSKERVVIDNLELNSWTNVTAVLDNTSVDIYLNGRLEKTSTIRYNLEKLDNTSNMYIAKNGGFAGYLAYAQVYQTPLEPDAVYNIYTKFKPKIDKWYYSKMDSNPMASPPPIDANCSGGGGSGPGPDPGPGDDYYTCIDNICVQDPLSSQSLDECNISCSPSKNNYLCNNNNKCVQGSAGTQSQSDCIKSCGKNPCD
jgi:hypothetical protein